jgi:hypothetical protein
MPEGFELSENERALMMQDFDLTVHYDHETFGKLISGNTGIDSLLLSADIMRRAVKHLDVLFEETLSPDDKTFLSTAVGLDLAMKVMHSIECTASLLAAYMKRNMRFHEEITRYSLDADAKELLRKSHEQKLSESEIWQLFGFPSNGGGRKEMIMKSCKLITESLKELSDFYFGHLDMYRRYKHGYPFAMSKMLNEKDGKVLGYIPMILFVTQEDVDRNKNKDGLVWQFGMIHSYSGILPFDIDELFHKLQLVYHLFMLAKYSCHIRTFSPELDLVRVWLDRSDIEKIQLDFGLKL